MSIAKVAAQTCGLLIMVIVPVSFVFALLSRVRFFTNTQGNFDAEWEDIGLHATRYKMYPSRTPTTIRRIRTLTPRQLFVRGIRDPAFDLEPWELAVLISLSCVTIYGWVYCCVCTRSKSKLKAH